MIATSTTPNAENCFVDPEPWPEPVDPGEVLEEIVRTIRRYIILEPEQADAAALWVVHTYLIDQAWVSPLLIINAPERACAKSLLQELLALFVLRALQAANSSASAVFRALDAWRCALLVDEADTFLRERPEMHGILNAGYGRNGFVLRTDTNGDKFEPRRYLVFGAKCLAGIALERHLPDATMSRGIEIRMRRKLPEEEVERFRNLDQQFFSDCRSKLARFAMDHAEPLSQAKPPPLPDKLSDRAQDNWEPLLAIALCAGQDWFNRATAAAIALSGKKENPAGAGNELLVDIREVFGTDTRLKTTVLLDRLIEDEEMAWATYNRGKPITPRQLAKLLEPYGIGPKTVRMGSDTPKGYERSQFDDAFRRYLPEAANSPQPWSPPQDDDSDAY